MDNIEFVKRVIKAGDFDEDVCRKIDKLIAEKVMGQKGIPLRYSTDITKAWQVVEKLIPLGYFEMSSWPNDYHVNFGSGDKFGYSKANTAPMAICLAALKAVGVTL